jgi:ribonuclease J
VFVPKWQRGKVKEAEQFWRVDEIKPYRIYEKELAANPSKWVIASNLQTARFLDMEGVLPGAAAIWSMWPGYMKDGSGEKYVTWLATKGIPLTIEHTSGHASVADLKRLATALAPRRIVPIHSFGSLSYSDLFDDVDLQDDGSWWEV